MEPPEPQAPILPWTPGYDRKRWAFITAAIRDPQLLDRFRGNALLPPRYGVGLDERCVEYPWMLSRIASRGRRLLDAGSVLNFRPLVEHPLLRGLAIQIVTLAPEHECFWNQGISYAYEDLRCLPFRDEWYDTVVSLSTLEHIGCDNAWFGAGAQGAEVTGDYVTAARELLRVLKPGGQLLLSVPFGLRQRFKFQHQFDSEQLDHLVSSLGLRHAVTRTFFRYSSAGWQSAQEQECATCEYVAWVARLCDTGLRPAEVVPEPDEAAAARAVACVEIRK